MKIFKDEDLPSVQNYQLKSLDSLRIFFYILFSILSLGIFWLISFWFPDIFYMLYTNEQDIWRSDYILFIRKDKQKFLQKIQRKKCKINPYRETRYYLFTEYEGQLFFFSPRKEKFVPVKDQIINYLKAHPEEYEKVLDGLEKQVVKDLRDFYGENKMQIEITPFFLQCCYEFLKPINFSQFIIVLLFFFLSRRLYAMVVFIYIIITVWIDAYEITNNRKKLRKISKNEDTILIKRKIGNEDFSGEFPINELVLGDIVELTVNSIIPCDLILLSGTCLVNEALLTGESLPILKNPVNLKKLDNVSINKGLLFGGTKIIHKKSEKLQALVIGTGWNTSKGKLLGSVLFAQNEVDRFLRDFLKILFIISFYYITLCVILVIYSFYYPIPNLRILTTTILDIGKQCFSPSLLFIMTASIQISSRKLSQKQIYTLKTNKIVEGGAVKTVCFDKTGTLTELNIKIFGYILREDQEFEQFSKDTNFFTEFNEYQNFIKGIAVCHSLENIKGQIFGDPLEETMFQNSKANIKQIIHPYFENQTTNAIVLCKKHKNQFKLEENQFYSIVKLIEFDSVRKRMSVLIEDNKTKELEIYCKGAPEIIKYLSKKETIPENYNQILEEFSKQGYRVLAIAKNTLSQKFEQIQNLSEIDLEKNLNFIGFLLFENPIKDTTQKTIQDLKKALLDVVMITGDNIYTGINIGYLSDIIEQNCSLWIGIFEDNKIKWIFQTYENRMIKQEEGEDNLHSIISSKNLSIAKTKQEITISKVIKDCELTGNKIALTGKCFQKICKIFQDQNDFIEKILTHTLIYARTSAKQKLLVIDQLKIKNLKSQTYVAFVGDGSNDTLALKRANIGLSIGNDETSFSASFFTPNSNIKSIKDIIIEGKVCLGNAFQNFFYWKVVLISLAMSLFLMVLQQWNFVTFDYIQSITLAFPIGYIMSRSKTRNKLTFIRQPPTLFSRTLLKNFFLTTFFFMIAQIMFYYFLINQEERKEYNNITKNFGQSSFSYDLHFFIEGKIFYTVQPIFAVFLCFVFYQGFPFKKRMLKNYFIIFYFFFLVILFICLNYTDIIFDKFPRIQSIIIYTSRFPNHVTYFRTKAILLIFFLSAIAGFTSKFLYVSQITKLYKEKQEKKKLFQTQTEKNLSVVTNS